MARYTNKDERREEICLPMFESGMGNPMIVSILLQLLESVSRQLARQWRHESSNSKPMRGASKCSDLGKDFVSRRVLAGYFLTS